MKNPLAVLCFKGLTQAYYVKTSITNNKYSTPQPKEDNDLNSAKSATQTLSLNLAWTFLILNF